MSRQRRVFNLYPDFLKTPQNDRETFAADDVLFEPENASFVNGFIGDSSPLSQEDLERNPLIREINNERQKYQLSVGSTLIDPSTQERLGAAFYTDLLRQISVNGGLVENPNRVFSTNLYTWTPPIDYDKHINFNRYLWVGEGTADVNGEYVTKEPSHSKTVIYRFNGSTFEKKKVTVVNTLPNPGPAGSYIEDGNSPNRTILRSTGSEWVTVNFTLVADVPTDASGFSTGDHVYVARTGPDFNRPLVWLYSSKAGRWLPQTVIVSDIEPETIREGMLWEDARFSPRRLIKIVRNGSFITLSPSGSIGPPGSPGVDGEYIYDARDYSTNKDPWSKENWWMHVEDLSPVDKSSRTSTDQAIRPILEFWNGLDAVPGDVKAFRNDTPEFKKFAYDDVAGEIIDTGETTSIYEFKTGTGDDDRVIGIPLSFDPTGEIEFELTLETAPTNFLGYKFFKDVHTGLVHSVWTKSDKKTIQEQDEDGLFSIPSGITSNPDHEVLTETSRGKVINHMTGVISSQENFKGDRFGLNSFRWSKKDPTVGATIVDNEQTLLRSLATLQSSFLDLPRAIRTISKEYNKVLFKFGNKLNQRWDDLTLTDGQSNELKVTASEAVDSILTELFIGRTEDFPFYLSDMGRYIETRISGGIATPIDSNADKPIFIAPSAARVGASPTYKPQKITERDGRVILRGHDGVIIDSYGDERDLVWLELQNRFFDEIPDRYKEENDSFSSRFSESNFFLDDFYGNYDPVGSEIEVDGIVADHNSEQTPTPGTTWFSKSAASILFFDGTTFVRRTTETDQIFRNLADGNLYSFNGLDAVRIDTWNRKFEFDYSDNEFRRVIRREFERYTIFRNINFSENENFDINDPFTWNFRSAGVEGHYRGIYRRVYNTTRPHSHPWEVMGYKIEPTWWQTQYPPDRFAADGSPRYGDFNVMWEDFASGIVKTPRGYETRERFEMAAPPPVNNAGTLLDPIRAGVVDNAKLDFQRIDDLWVYGDGAPAEQEFIESPFYPFALAIAGYLMKNGVWVDTLWSEVFINIGDVGENRIFNAPHIVHRDTLTRPSIDALPIHLDKDDDNNLVQRLGVNAWISEFVQLNGGNPEQDFGEILRNTFPALSWRTGGFINENRTVISTLSRKEIPFEDVHVILHRSQPINSFFSSGVTVVRENSGYRVFGFDPFTPVFRVDTPLVPVIGGQVEQRQEFEADFLDNDEAHITGGVIFPNQRIRRTYEVTKFRIPRNVNSSDTATFRVIVNGVRVNNTLVRISGNNSIELSPRIPLSEGDSVVVSFLTTQTNPQTQTRQFTVNGVAFPYFAKGSGVIDEVEYGRFFESATDVVNFMIGYGRAQEKEGWRFDQIEGGQRKDWLLGAKLFGRFSTTSQEGDVFNYTPMGDKAAFNSEFGQSLNVESIMNGAFGIVNKEGNPIDTDETLVSRSDDGIVVSRVDPSNPESEIFGLRVNLSVKEHAIIFSNTTEFGDITYDPVIALFHKTLFVDTYRSNDWNGSLEANGWIVDGGRLQPNFEKQAFDITRFYDRFRTVDDPIKRDQARTLYGYPPPVVDQYMNPIGAADRSKFDYYRAMIQTKGTRQPVDAFVRGTVLGSDNFFLTEDWAWKLTEFGDLRNEILQFNLDARDFRENVQVFVFGQTENLSNFTVEIPDFDRQDINNNSRWIRPPEKCEIESTCNLRFPVDTSGLPDTNTSLFSAKMFDTDRNDETITSFFHFDPELDKFDSLARTQIDFEGAVDPARYNKGPEAAFSDELAWGDKQVGNLWWDRSTTRFVDYRSLIPDPADNSNYEEAARFWGRLDFFNVDMERDGNTVTVTTYSPFDSSRTGSPVSHGLEEGDIVSFSGADQTEFNLENVEVSFPKSVISAEGTTDFSPTNGTIGSTIFPEENRVLGSIQLSSKNQTIGTVRASDLAGDAFASNSVFTISTNSGTQQLTLTETQLDNIIDEINLEVSLREVEAFNSGGRLGFRNTLGNEGEPFTLIDSGSPSLLSQAGITPGTFEIIEAGTSFTISTVDTSPALIFTSSEGGSVDRIVAEINDFFEENNLVSVDAFTEDRRIGFRNAAGFEGERFTLGDNGNSLLGVVGISSGSFEIIPPNTTVTIGTESFSTTINSVRGGTLDALVSDINNAIIAQNSNPIVRAINNDQRLQLANTNDNEGRRFTITATSPLPPGSTDLVSLAGITSGAFEEFSSGADITIRVSTNTLTVTLSQSAGLETVIAEINSSINNSVIEDVEAFETSGGSLGIRNSIGSEGISFTLSNTTGGILDIAGIIEGTFSLPSANPNQFTFEIDTQPASPATGNPKVTVGRVDIYQWVKSSVPPEDWNEFVSGITDPDATTGEVLNVDNPSYVQRQRQTANGRLEDVFYFWVKNSTGVNPGKIFRPSEISRRIGNPRNFGIPWFAPVDRDHMVVFTNGFEVQDSYAMEVSIDQRELETHVAWVLISEGDQFRDIPTEIKKKIIDSLSGEDEAGHEVPSLLLSDSEKFGSSFFPSKTIYRDRKKAVEIYVQVLNSLLSTENLSEVDTLTGIFKLDTEFEPNTNPTGFWSKETFIDPTINDRSILETVSTIAERDKRLVDGFYVSGDLVKVVRSGSTDPWTGDEVASIYQLIEGGIFIQVGVENNTVKINDNIDNDASEFRTIFNQTFNIFSIRRRNELVFSMLHEMLVQNIGCDWFFKTSYISTQFFTRVDKSPFVRADEISAVRDNIIDTKAFRTKFRGVTNTLTIREDENMGVIFQEFPDKKITLLFDRLSCDASEDGGWETYPWDTTNIPGIGWDKPFWDFSDLGREEFYLLDTFIGDSVRTEFEAVPIYDPTLYNTKVIIKRNGNIIEPEDTTLVPTVIKTHTTIKIKTNFPLPVSFTLELFVAQGFREGLEPSLGVNLENTQFRPVESTYEHHYPRTLKTVTEDGEFFNPNTVVSSCTGDSVGATNSPNERIVNEISPSVNICVKQDFELGYGAWDTVPWDITGWDEGPTDIGLRVFLLASNESDEIPPGIEIFPTSEDITVTNAPYVVATFDEKNTDLIQIEQQIGGAGSFNTLNEGVEFDFFVGKKNILEFKTPDSATQVADGSTTIFNFSSSIPTSIDKVFVNGELQQLGVDYSLGTPTEIEFVQPPPSVINVIATPSALGTESDGIETEFTTNSDIDTIVEENFFVFSNKVLRQAPADYQIDPLSTGQEIVFGSPPPPGNEVLVWGLNNNQGISSPLFSIERMRVEGSNNYDRFVASPGQTTFNTNTVNTIPLSGNIINQYVFRNGLLQREGASASYVITGTNQITFNDPLDGGDNVFIIDAFDLVGNNYEEIFATAGQSVVNTTLTVQSTTSSTVFQRIYVNGLLQREGIGEQVIVTGSNQLTFDEPLSLDDEIIILLVDTSVPNVDRFDATSGQTVFNTTNVNTDPVTSTLLSIVVFRNGIMQLEAPLPIGDFTVTGANQITFNDPVALNDDISVLVPNLNANETIFNTTPTGGFTTDERTFVFVNGLYQVLGSDYTIPATNQIVFTSPLTIGDDIEIRVLTSTDVNVDHFVVSASGNPTDSIPGFFDADDPIRYMVFLDDQIQDGYGSVFPTDFTVSDDNPDTLEWTDTPSVGQNISIRVIREASVASTTIITPFPLAGSEITATANPYISNGDVVRFRFNGWRVGSAKDFDIVSTINTNYEFVQGFFRYDTLPSAGLSTTINFLTTRKGDLRHSILIRTPVLVNDIRANHLDFDSPDGFETNRVVGTQIINTIDNTIYAWDGVVWNSVGTVPIGQQIYVTRLQEVYEFDGVNYNRLFVVGLDSPTPPFLPFPNDGKGITFGTYAYGQAPDASTDYPEALEIINNPGDCIL